MGKENCPMNANSKKRKKREVRNKLNVTRDRLEDASYRKKVLFNENGEFDIELNSLNKLNMGISGAREGVIDAECLNHLTDINLQQAKALNESKFFTTRDLVGNLHEKFVTETGTFDWERLGREVSVYFKGVPRVDFMLGPLDVKKEKKKKAKKRKRAEENHREIRPEESTVEDQDADKVTATRIDEVKAIFKAKINSLATAHAEKRAREKASQISQSSEKESSSDEDVEDETGFDAIKLLLNPTSYSQTIENIFYYSFLVKNGYAGVRLDDDGLPEATLPEASQERALSRATQGNLSSQGMMERKTNKQFIFSLDYDQWEALCEGYKIENAIIPTREGSVVNDTPRSSKILQNANKENEKTKSVNKRSKKKKKASRKGKSKQKRTPDEMESEECSSEEE